MIPIQIFFQNLVLTAKIFSLIESCFLGNLFLRTWTQELQLLTSMVLNWEKCIRHEWWRFSAKKKLATLFPWGMSFEERSLSKAKWIVQWERIYGRFLRRISLLICILRCTFDFGWYPWQASDLHPSTEVNQSSLVFNLRRILCSKLIDTYCSSLGHVQAFISCSHQVAKSNAI